MELPMTERDALFAAVCANPDDDTPRLVFADWLQEHGEEKRAAFIRAQIALFRRQTIETEAGAVAQFFEAINFTDLGDIDWSQVSEELGELNAAEKRAEKCRYHPVGKGDGLPRTKGVRFIDVERGMLNEVKVDNPAAFLKNLDAIFRAAPITSIRFDNLTADHAREFVASGHLAKVRHLVFDDPTDADAIRIIGEHPDAACINWLELDADDTAGAQMAALSAGSHFSGVTRLELMGLGAGDDIDADQAFSDLVRRPQFRRLRQLASWGNDLGDASCRAVVAAGLTELRFLDLSINGIEDAGALAIANAKSLPNLRYLNLGSCDFSGRGASALIVSPKLPKLSVLQLDYVHMKDLTPQMLAKANRGPTLRVLHLDRAELTARGAAALGKCPAVQGLWFLSFQNTNLNDAALIGFTKHAKLGQLTAFDLSGNKLTERGMAALAAWPGAASLQSIDISGNKPGEAGAKALIASEYFRKLKRMNVTGKGTARLRKHFGKKVVP
jgi:uncharacterized protein (TIGR02996 family)